LLTGLLYFMEEVVTMTNEERQRADTIKNKACWLEAHRQTGIVTATCQATNIGRSTIYEWMHDDPDFAKAKLEAENEAIELLEAEARRRAFEGTEKPVYQGGRKVGKVREYSDTLMIFILKAKKPEYRDRHDINLDVKGTIALNDLIDDSGSDDSSGDDGGGMTD
jgi:hypothetical protein